MMEQGKRELVNQGEFFSNVDSNLGDPIGY